MLVVFLKGLFVGLLIAIPVGPVGVLCVRRTLTQGKISGLVSGLGAATADALYAAVTGLGVSYISEILLDYRRWIELVGGVFLLVLGVKSLRAKPCVEEVVITKKRMVGDYFTTFMLTLTSPATILAFAAFFAGIGLASAITSPFLAIVVVAGVFCGSALWWLALSELMGLLHQRNPQALLAKLNIVSGIILVGFGVAVLFLN